MNRIRLCIHFCRQQLECMRISAELGFKSAVSFGEGDMEERFSRE